MKQILHEANGKTFLLCEVPGRAIQFVADMGYLIYKVTDESKMVTDKQFENDFVRLILTGRSKYENASEHWPYKPSAQKIPEGNWKIIGKASELDWEEAKEIVEDAPTGLKIFKSAFKNYCSKDEFKGNALFTSCDSLDSLVLSHSLQPEQTVILQREA